MTHAARRNLLVSIAVAAALGRAALSLQPSALSLASSPSAAELGRNLRSQGRALRLQLEAALRRLPGTNVGKEGRPGNALNVVFVASEEQLKEALKVAGWSVVPQSMAASIADGFCELAQGRWPASFPPMYPYTLFGHEQDMNFSIPTAFPSSRHHFRLWRSPFVDESGRPIWWAAADYDVSIRWRDLSHVPDPDINRERDFLASTLKGLAKQLQWIALPQVPREGADDRGYSWKGDGRVLLATF